MKSQDNNSEKKHQRPNNEVKCVRTLKDVMAEIQEITDNTHWAQTRTAKLESKGYQIENCWVKNGSIASIWYMKQKKEIRIQVTESESHGKFHKAKCVIIPASDILFQASDEIKVRNLPDFK